MGLAILSNNITTTTLRKAPQAMASQLSITGTVRKLSVLGPDKAEFTVTGSAGDFVKGADGNITLNAWRDLAPTPATKKTPDIPSNALLLKPDDLTIDCENDPIIALLATAQQAGTILGLVVNVTTTKPPYKAKLVRLEYLSKPTA